MLETMSTLKLLVCQFTGKRLDKSLLGTLDDAGMNYDVHEGALDSANPDDALGYDCILVDWRDASQDVANFFSSLAGSIPTIALINSDQAQSDLNLIGGFNDFVCEQEIGLSTFHMRIRRLVSRYRDPMSLTSTHSPEAQLLQTVVNHSTDWVFIKDLKHRFLAVSEEYANSLERSFDSVIGKNDLEVGFTEDVVLGSERADWRGFWPQDDEAISKGEPTVETNPYWRVFTGDTRHRKTIRVPLKNHWGEVYALMVCSEDVTAIVKAEQILRERNEILEKVTQEKLKADHSRLMAELAVTAKNKFIATASHDLRQPLHALGLYLDVLESKLSSDDQIALIAKIKNSTSALSVLFNSLLDLSRLDAGVVEVESTHFSIEPLLTNLRVEFKEVAADKALEIEVAQSDAVLLTDAVLLERILRNLIQNAITHTESGKVEVKCEIVDEYLRVDVSDTGPGIPQYEQNAIFSEYYQLDHQGRPPTIGLGLGLAIVRRLVDLMDVKFELVSASGKGSVFSLELPLGDINSISEVNSLPAQTELQGQTILIIDDESDILDGMMHVLRAHGCSSITALSAAQAIEKLTEKDVVPSMIVADYRLQNGQTGDMAIERIREEFNSEIPAIIVTGDTSADRLKEATQSGFRLLHKPVQSVELLSEITSHLVGSTKATV